MEGDGSTQCGEISYPGTNCDDEAVWVDGSRYNESVVPGLTATFNVPGDPARYLPLEYRFDDARPWEPLKYVCELPC